MNIRPEKSALLSLFLLLSSMVGFAVGCPAFRSFKRERQIYAENRERGKVVVILDFPPETWDEMAPVCFYVIEKLLEKENEVAVMSTDLRTSYWFECFNENFYFQDKSGEINDRVSWAGFLPGLPSSAAEIFRDPELVIGKPIFRGQKIKYAIFSSGENFHLWMFFGWARNRPDAVYYTSSSYFPIAQVYISSGQAPETSQSISGLSEGDFYRRRSSVSWFCVLFASLLVFKIAFSGFRKFFSRAENG
ncbi:hypothetical protein JXA84_04725 [candidate division WOR-3 bacterium]|nr:hypothetical protein [candidate division WOR-3 bacterium]